MSSQRLFYWAPTGQHVGIGGVYEWMLDWYADAYPIPCNNCARTTESPTRPGARAFRGGYSAMGVSYSFERYSGLGIDFAFGSRCARRGP